MRTEQIAWTIALLLAAVPLLPAQVSCDVQQLRGNWSMTSAGWAIPTAPGPWTVGATLPIAGVGVAVIDSAGRITGPGTLVMNGLVLDYEMTGTVEVTADCVGVIKYTVRIKGMPDLPGYVERLVYGMARNEMTSVSIQSPISKPMWITTWKRISNVPAAVAWPSGS